MDELRVFGRRVRELRCWRRLTLREAAGLAGLSFSFWGQVERGEKPVARRGTLEATADALRVHPTDLTGQPLAPREPIGADAQTGLDAIEDVLAHYELGIDPAIPVRPWPQIVIDLQRLDTLSLAGDYLAQSELAPTLLGELYGVYVRLPHLRPEVRLRLMDVHQSVMWTTKRLGIRGLPSLASRAVQQCAQTLDDPVWLGYAAWIQGAATGSLNRAAHYQRSVAAAESLTSRLDSSDAVQDCGMLHTCPPRRRSARRPTTTPQPPTWRRSRHWLPGWIPRSVPGRPAFRADQCWGLEDRNRP